MRIVTMTSLAALMCCAAPALAQTGGLSAPAPGGVAETPYEMTEAGQAGYHAIEPKTVPDAAAVGVAPSPQGGTLATPDTDPEDANPVPHTLNAQYADIRSHRRAERPLASAPADEPATARSADAASAPVAPELVASAVAFRAYMQRSAEVSPKFTSAAMVKASLERAEAYKIQQLAAGEVAYAALVALQDADFVEGVSKLKAYPQSREAIMDELVSAPENVMQIDGSMDAAAAARGAMAGLGRALVADGRSVKKAAYTIQADAWSKKAAEGQEERLADAKKISQLEAAASKDDTKLLLTSLASYRTRGQSSEAGAPSTAVTKGLALAALMVLGDADEAHLSRLAPLLQDAKNADCLNMAKLNLFQCLSVAGPEYEDVFCLGEHAMTDTGQCVVRAAGAPIVPAEAAPSPAPRLIEAVAQEEAPADVQVPVAFASHAPAAVASNAEPAGR